MRVRLKRGWSKTYPELSVGNVYRVLGIEADSLRIMSDAGEPILFYPTAFAFDDSALPTQWIAKRGEDGELYAYPPELHEPGFFEKFFDYDKRARQTLHASVHQLCHDQIAVMPDPPNTYVRVDRRRANAEEPISRYSELDDDSWEVRKIEVFRDGRVTYADGKGSTGATKLGSQPAANADAARDSELKATEIQRAEFEVVWNRALDSDEP